MNGMLSLGRRPFTSRQKGNWVRLVLPDGRMLNIGVETESRRGERCCRVLLQGVPVDIRIERTDLEVGTAPPAPGRTGCEASD